MKKIRVIECIKSLDSKELKQLTKLINSSYFNEHKGTKDAYNHIIVSIKKNKQLDREALHAVVFPNESYNSQRISNVLSYIMKLFEQFIVQHYSLHLDFSKLSFLTFLDEKGLDSYYNKEAIQATKEAGHPLLSFYTHQLINKRQADRKKRTKTQSLEHSNSALDFFYFKEKFKLGCKMLSQKNVISSDFNFQLFDELEKYFDQNSDNLLDYFPMKLYFISYKMIKYDDTQIYLKVKNEIRLNGETLDTEDRQEVYAYLQNFSIKKINNGHTDFLNELFQIYQEIIGNEVIFSKGYLSQWEYKNIITAGCRLKKIKWTRNFIEVYKDKLKLDSRDNAYKFNLASFYNTLGKHHDTLSVLRNVQFSDIYYHLNTNVILIKTYVALQEHELLRNLLDTFRIFVLRNNKVSSYQKKLYKNLIRYVRKLSLLEEKKTLISHFEYLEKKKHLHEQISSNKNTIAIDWLLEVSLVE